MGIIKKLKNYLTEKIYVRDHTETVSWPVSGDGHSFDDQCEEQTIVTPIYRTRLDTILGGAFTISIIAGLSYVAYISIEGHNNLEKNKSMVHQINRISKGDDYTLDEDEKRELIRELGIPYSQELPLSFTKLKKATISVGGRDHTFEYEHKSNAKLDLTPTHQGANWRLTEYGNDLSERGQISQETLENYLENHSGI